ncbi:MAG TPA: DUF6644 family protein [Bryobacteraceae bacterium]|nr:DUF6644 family protein [Bryobacteraceae bacterium]
MFLAYDPATNPLNNTQWAFPFFECIHIAMFAMSVGTIAMVDFRMLGIGMRHQTPAQLLKDTSLWTLAGLIVVVTSGMVIWTTDPLRYYYNWAFRYKIIALVAAIIYNYTIHRTVARSAMSATFGTALTATFSLLIWISIVFAGLFYAFT